MTFGWGCIRPDGVEGPPCSYASRVASWLGCGNNASLVHFQNRAHGGTTSAGSLPQLPLLLDTDVPADLCIIDFSVNDAWEDPSQAAAATEAMLRFFAARHPRMAVLLVDSYCVDASHAHTRVKHQVADAYGVPLLSYREVLAGPCEDFGWLVRPSNAKNALAHPNATTHEYLAAMVVAWWQRAAPRFAELATKPAAYPAAAAREVPPAISNATLLSRLSVCAPLSVFDPRAGTVFDPRARRGGGGATPRVTAGNWSSFEDQRGKPGYISTGPVGSKLEFDLMLGASPRIAVVYDRGYEGFGFVLAYLKSARADEHLGRLCSRHRSMACDVYHYRLDGQRDDASRVTQSDLHVFHFGLQPNSNETLVLELMSPAPRKFKVRYVTSC